MTRRPIGILVAVAGVLVTGAGTTGLPAAVAMVSLPHQGGPGPATVEQPPAAETDPDIHRLAQRLTRRLGTSSSDDERVRIRTEEHILEVVWALEDPAHDKGAASRATKVARRAELRRELRIVVRVLAGQPVPAGVTIIKAIAIDPDDSRGTGSGHPILDATFTAATFEALRADDMRLDDATLEELLGLAEAATGDPAWGSPTT